MTSVRLCKRTFSHYCISFGMSRHPRLTRVLIWNRYLQRNHREAGWSRCTVVKSGEGNIVRLPSNMMRRQGTWGKDMYCSAVKWVDSSRL